MGRVRRRVAAGFLAASLTVGSLAAAPSALAAPDVVAQGFPRERVCQILFRFADRFGDIPQARRIIFNKLVEFGCISPG